LIISFPTHLFDGALVKTSHQHIQISDLSTPEIIRYLRDITGNKHVDSWDVRAVVELIKTLDTRLEGDEDDSEPPFEVYRSYAKGSEYAVTKMNTGKWICECPDHHYHHRICEHIIEVKYSRH